MTDKAAGSKSSPRAELAGRTLWSARTRERYFLVPDDLTTVEPMSEAPPTEGMFELGTITGRRRLVREEEVRAYEVTRDQAVEWLQVELDPAIQTLKDAAIANAERMLEAAGRLRAENAASVVRFKKTWASTRPRSSKSSGKDAPRADDES